MFGSRELYPATFFAMGLLFFLSNFMIIFSVVVHLCVWLGGKHPENERLLSGCGLRRGCFVGSLGLFHSRGQMLK